MTPDEQKTFEILADGYNNWRKKQGWTKTSVADLMEWEKYKLTIVERIEKRLKAG